MATNSTVKYRRKDLKNWKPTFLKVLAETGIVGVAARRAKIHRVSAYEARETMDRKGADLVEALAFGAAWEAALEQAGDTLELEAWRRALEGVENMEPIFYRGKRVGERAVRTYSDRLLVFLLKAHRPEKYGENTGGQSSGRGMHLRPGEQFTWQFQNPALLPSADELKEAERLRLEKYDDL